MSTPVPNYRPIGQLLGNSPADAVNSDAPANSSGLGYPTTQPRGAAALAGGEGASAAAWNRYPTAVGRNVDRLWYAGLVRPVAAPLRLSSTEVPALASFSDTELDLTPGGAFDGWVYHGTSTGDLANLFQLVDGDGTPCLDSTGAVVTVDDVLYLSDDSSAVGATPTLHTTTVAAPANTTHAHHQLVMAAAPSTSAGVGATTPMAGVRVKISSSSANDVAKGTNNGRYLLAGGVGADTQFPLVEYRHRLRLRSGSGTFSATQTITGVSSGASGTIAASGDVVSGDYVEFDAITYGTGKAPFAAGEVVGNGLGATATVVAYTAPGDPVFLNNDMSAAGSVIVTPDGAFSCLVKLSLSAAPVGGGDKLLIAGGKGHPLGLERDALLRTAVAVSTAGGYESVIAGMKGEPDDYADLPMSVLGNVTGGPRTYADLNAAFNRQLVADTDVRGDPDARIVMVSGVSGTFSADETVYQRSALGSVSTTSGSATLTGSGTSFLSLVQPGSTVLVAGALRTVASVASNTSLTVTSNFSANNSGATGYVLTPVGTLLATYSSTAGGAVDVLVLSTLQGNLSVSGTVYGGTSGATATWVSNWSDGRTIEILTGGPLALTGEGGGPSGLLRIRQGGGVSGLRVDGTGMSVNADRKAVVTIDAPVDYDRGNADGAAPSSVLDVRVPVYLDSAGVAAVDNPVGYAYAAAKYTLTFRGSADLTAFQADAAFTAWPTNSVLVEVYDASDPVLEGLFLPEFMSTTTLRLKRLGGTGYFAKVPTNTSGVAKVRFIGRAVAVRGYFSDYSGNNQAALLTLLTCAGETGLVIGRPGAISPPAQSLLLVADSATRLGVLIGQSSSDSDDPAYFEGPTAHINKIRSQTDKLAASVNGTRLIRLDQPNYIDFQLSEAGGSAAASVARVEVAHDGGPNKLKVLTPSGGSGVGALSLNDEWYVEHSAALGDGYLLFARDSGGATPYSSMVLLYLPNVTNNLYVMSPTGSAGSQTDLDTASHDTSAVVLGNNEVALTARGNGTAGRPDVLIHRASSVNETFLKVVQSDGTQEAADGAGVRPLVHVPDIRYGADSAGYTGKKIIYPLSLAEGAIWSTDPTAPAWRLSHADGGASGLLSAAAVTSDLGSVTWALGPTGARAYNGATSEEGLAQFTGVRVRYTLSNAADDLYMDLFEMNASTGVSTLLTRVYGNFGVATGGVRTATFALSVKGVAQAVYANNTLVLNNVDDPALGYSAASAVNDAYTGWTADITSGTANADTPKVITGYVGSTRTASFGSTWSSVLTGSSVYHVYRDAWVGAADKQLYLRVTRTGSASAVYIHGVDVYTRTTAIVPAL